jgi:type IV pilus biogenesis protein CpaD/CtpE
MNRSLKLLVLATLAPIALAACENPTKPKYTLSPSFGDAVNHNMAVQILNPDGNPDLTPPPMDGARAAEAVERYRAGKTRDVVRIKTSEVGTEAK